MSTELQCYRTNCGKTYTQEQNKRNSCRFHPGVPVFHDALKSWSCCGKRSTDFTEFLNTPGCTFGFHSNEKPAPPPKPSQVIQAHSEFVTVGPSPNRPTRSQRPSADEEMRVLEFKVMPSLAEQLPKILSENTNKQTIDDGSIPIDLPCSNRGCKGRYKGEESNKETCIYHPGGPVFHEGMKYWSCCDRKTTEFDKFLDQEGCEHGYHKWDKQILKKTDCRLDWFQTGNKVDISLFAKYANPTKSVIKANQVKLDVNIVLADGTVFQKSIELNEVIDIKKSQVKFAPSKVEISLAKAKLTTWRQLSYQSSDEIK